MFFKNLIVFNSNSQLKNSYKYLEINKTIKIKMIIEWSKNNKIQATIKLLFQKLKKMLSYKIFI